MAEKTEKRTARYIEHVPAQGDKKERWVVHFDGSLKAATWSVTCKEAIEKSALQVEKEYVLKYNDEHPDWAPSITKIPGVYEGDPKGGNSGWKGGASYSLEAAALQAVAYIACHSKTPEQSIEFLVANAPKVAKAMKSAGVNSFPPATTGTATGEARGVTSSPSAVPMTDERQQLIDNAIAVFGSETKVVIGYKNHFGSPKNLEDISDDELVTLVSA